RYLVSFNHQSSYVHSRFWNKICTWSKIQSEIDVAFLLQTNHPIHNRKVAASGIADVLIMRFISLLCMLYEMI
ncbi:MAG: hypothetical protein IJB72_00630, partial [Clostridia bacterium]|nr:hypothetical protein [Clostridia bacterium]